MDYSKIKSVEVINFMVYSHAVINFDDVNIINIKGYNSGGKSTMLKAIAVCLMNMYPKAQTKFIRHGEKYFRIKVSFEDGVVIVKDKYVSGQSLYELYKDDKCIFTTKEGGRLTKIDGVPQVIQDYLGLCVVSTGCLNYQVRQDPLWLIETTGSENYNSLNEILKTEEIARANALLNSDKNKVNSEVTGIEASLNETNYALNEVRDYSDALLSALEKKESFCRDLVSMYRDLKSLMGIVDTLSTIKDIPEVAKIDSSQLEGVNALYRTATDINGIVDYPEMEKLDAVRLSAITSLAKEVVQVDNTPDVNTPEVTVIDIDKLANISSMIATISKLKENNDIIMQLDSKKNKVKAKLDSIVLEAKKQGIKFVECDNCGTYIEVSV